MTFPFYKDGNSESARLSTFSKGTQLVNERAKISDFSECKASFHMEVLKD